MSMDIESNVNYNPFEQMTFTYDRCFLCGCLLDRTNYSIEHVLPKWLQRNFALWNQQLVLLNGRSIRYKQLTIPCCKGCNNTMSKCIEKPIERCVNKGYEEIINIDRSILFQWLNKISYGIIFKELSLRTQITNPNSEPIFTTEDLREHKMQFLFLKTLITETTFVNNPGSILLFKIDPCDAEPFWMFESPFVKTFCIRMNDIGIIAHLMDGGFNQSFFMQSEEMRELLSKTLHPIQFAEVSARFIYKSSLFYRNPSFITVLDNFQNPNIIISNQMSGNGYNDWSQEDYAHVLSSFWDTWGFTYNDIYKENGLVLTYLRNDDGTFKDFFSLHE